MEFQDWKPIVFTKNKSKENNSNKKINNDNSYNDNELPEKIKKVEKNEQISMMKSRIEMGYKTQKDLANATNGKISQKRINEIENGKGVKPNGTEKNILYRLLNIKFK